MTRRKWRRRRG